MVDWLKKAASVVENGVSKVKGAAEGANNFREAMLSGPGELLSTATDILEATGAEGVIKQLPGVGDAYGLVKTGVDVVNNIADGDVVEGLRSVGEGLLNNTAMGNRVQQGLAVADQFTGGAASNIVNGTLDNILGGRGSNDIDPAISNYVRGRSTEDLIDDAYALGMDPDALMQGDFSSLGDHINTGRYANPYSSSSLGNDNDYGLGNFNGMSGVQNTGNPDLDAIVNSPDPAQALADLDDADRAQLLSSLDPQQSAALRNAVNNAPDADNSLSNLFDGMGIEQRGAAAQAKLEEISAGLEAMGADKTAELSREKLGKLIEKTFDQAEFNVIASYLQMFQSLLDMLLRKDTSFAEKAARDFGK